MREEQDRRSRDWERLGELQEAADGTSWWGLAWEEAVEHSNGGKHVSACLTSTPSSPPADPPSAQAECLLRGAGGRKRRMGKVKELGASCCRDRGRGLNLGGRESLCDRGSWQILNTASPTPSSPPLLLPGDGCFDNGDSPPPSLLLTREAGYALGLVSRLFDWT